MKFFQADLALEERGLFGKKKKNIFKITYLNKILS